MRTPWIPAASALTLLILLAAALYHHASAGPATGQAPGTLTKALRRLPMDQLTLPLLATQPGTPAALETASLKGKAWVLNAWASWCGACVAEHGFLKQQARQGRTPLIGLNFQDEAEAARQWLARHGNPYQAVVRDPQDRLGLDMGIVALPETFVIDREGHVRLRLQGPLDAQRWAREVQPVLDELEAGRG